MSPSTPVSAAVPQTYEVVVLERLPPPRTGVRQRSTFTLDARTQAQAKIDAVRRVGADGAQASFAPGTGGRLKIIVTLPPSASAPPAPTPARGPR